MRLSFLSLLAGCVVLLGPAASAQDVTAEPTYGSESLDEGFLPDPYELDLTAGGSIAVDLGACAYGHVAMAPDLDLYYTTSGNSDLYFFAVSGSDTMILVNTPSGDWLCDDDSYDDGDPLLVIPAAEDGLYNVWVGTYGEDTAPATLFISEVDPR